MTESAQIHPYEQSGTEQPRDVTTGEVEADVNTSKISNDLKMYNSNLTILCRYASIAMALTIENIHCVYLCTPRENK